MDLERIREMLREAAAAAAAKSPSPKSTARSPRSATALRKADREATKEAKRIAARAEAAAAAAIREQDEIIRERELALMSSEDGHIRSLELNGRRLALSRASLCALLRDVQSQSASRRSSRVLLGLESLAELRSPRDRKNLKSDYKRSAALVHRVTAANKETLTALLTDMNSLNLSRYASEVAASLASCDRWKSSDIGPLLVPLCEALHKRYADATSMLLHCIFAQLRAIIPILMNANAASGPGGSGNTASSSVPSTTAPSSSSASSAATGPAHPLLTAILFAKSRVPLVQPPDSGETGGSSSSSDFLDNDFGFGAAVALGGGVGGKSGVGTGPASKKSGALKGGGMNSSDFDSLLSDFGPSPLPVASSKGTAAASATAASLASKSNSGSAASSSEAKASSSYPPLPAFPSSIMTGAGRAITGSTAVLGAGADAATKLATSLATTGSVALSARARFLLRWLLELWSASIYTDSQGVLVILLGAMGVEAQIAVAMLAQATVPPSSSSSSSSAAAISASTAANSSNVSALPPLPPVITPVSIPFQLMDASLLKKSRVPLSHAIAAATSAAAAAATAAEAAAKATSTESAASDSAGDASSVVQKKVASNSSSVTPVFVVSDATPLPSDEAQTAASAALLDAIGEKTARRASRDSALVSSVLRFSPEDLLGVIARSTRLGILAKVVEIEEACHKSRFRGKTGGAAMAALGTTAEDDDKKVAGLGDIVLHRIAPPPPAATADASTTSSSSTATAASSGAGMAMSNSSAAASSTTKGSSTTSAIKASSPPPIITLKSLPTPSKALVRSYFVQPRGCLENGSDTFDESVVIVSPGKYGTYDIATRQILAQQATTSFVSSGDAAASLPPPQSATSLSSRQVVASGAAGSSLPSRSVLYTPLTRTFPVYSHLFSPAEQSVLLRVADRHYDCAYRALVADHRAMKRCEKRCDLLLYTRGAIPERLSTELEGLRATVQGLIKTVSTLADVLDRDLPDLPELIAFDEDELEEGGDSAAARKARKATIAGAISANPYAPFDDAASSSFYRDMPALREILPPILFDGMVAAGSSSATSDAASAEGGSSAAPATVIMRASIARDDTKHIKGTLDAALTQFLGAAHEASNSSSSSSSSAAVSQGGGSASSGTGGGGSSTSKQSRAPVIEDLSVVGTAYLGKILSMTDDKAAGGSVDGANSSASATSSDESKSASSDVYQPSSKILEALMEDENLAVAPSSMASTAASAPAAASSSSSSLASSAATPSSVLSTTPIDKSAQSFRLSAMLQRLLTNSAASRDACDAWVLEFITERLCTRQNRSRLLKHLFNASASSNDSYNSAAAEGGGRGRQASRQQQQQRAAAVLATDLFPYWARVVASLSAAMPGFGEPLVALLAEELSHLLFRLSKLAAAAAAKNARAAAMGGGGGSRSGGGPVDSATGMNIVEARAIHNTRFLCELIKFGVAPAPLAFGALERCLAAFTPESISVLCVVLESAGRYLHALPETHDHMARFLETLAKARAMRLSAAAGLVGGAAAVAAIGDALDAAVHAVVPPQRTANARALGELFPTMTAFVRHLILDRLSLENAEDVIKVLRKLPWRMTEGFCEGGKVAAFYTSAAVKKSLVDVSGTSASAPATSSSSATASIHPASSTDAAPIASVAVSLVNSIRPPPAASAAPSEECAEDCVLRALLAGVRLDWKRQEAIASLVVGLSKFHDRIATRFVDELCENIQQTLEADDTLVLASTVASPEEALGGGNSGTGMSKGSGGIVSVVAVAPRVDSASALRQRSQWRLGACRLLGECYNYKLVESATIFRTLYAIINTGHAVPLSARRAAVNAVNEAIQAAKEGGRVTATETEGSELPPHPLVLPPWDPSVGSWGFHPLVPTLADPPTNVFRIRLALTLLETCGPFWSRGTAAQRLDRYLVYFQRYALSKSPVPIETEFSIAEVLENLRPGLQRFGGLYEAEVAASVLERDEALAAAEMAQQVHDFLEEEEKEVRRIAASLESANAAPTPETLASLGLDVLKISDYSERDRAGKGSAEDDEDDDDDDEDDDDEDDESFDDDEDGGRGRPEDVDEDDEDYRRPTSSSGAAPALNEDDEEDEDDEDDDAEEEEEDEGDDDEDLDLDDDEEEEEDEDDEDLNVPGRDAFRQQSLEDEELARELDNAIHESLEARRAGAPSSILPNLLSGQSTLLSSASASGRGHQGASQASGVVLNAMARRAIAEAVSVQDTLRLRDLARQEAVADDDDEDDDEEDAVEDEGDEDDDDDDDDDDGAVSKRTKRLREQRATAAAMAVEDVPVDDALSVAVWGNAVRMTILTNESRERRREREKAGITSSAATKESGSGGAGIGGGGGATLVSSVGVKAKTILVPRGLALAEAALRSEDQRRQEESLLHERTLALHEQSLAEEAHHEAMAERAAERAAKWRVNAAAAAAASTSNSLSVTPSDSSLPLRVDFTFGQSRGLSAADASSPPEGDERYSRSGGARGGRRGGRGAASGGGGGGGGGASHTPSHSQPSSAPRNTPSTAAAAASSQQHGASPATAANPRATQATPTAGSHAPPEKATRGGHANPRGGGGGRGRGGGR